MGLQPGGHGVAAWRAWGCSLEGIGLQGGRNLLERDGVDEVAAELLRLAQPHLVSVRVMMKVRARG
jgi:hypothetical protein